MAKVSSAFRKNLWRQEMREVLHGYSRWCVLRGDMLQVLRRLPDNCIDSVVCDPPYGISFMGKGWDDPARKIPFKERTGHRNSGIMKGSGRGGSPAFLSRQRASAAVTFQRMMTEWFTECFRVLKPGGHVLAFGGTRMSHRLACGIEDAGFEIRDTLLWMYGQGFPKSRDISKSIDEEAFQKWLSKRPNTKKRLASLKGAAKKQYKQELLEKSGFARRIIGVSSVTGGRSGSAIDDGNGLPESRDTRMLQNPESVVNFQTAPATPEAVEWEGWGTALKPSYEPIIMARKPLAEKTISDNVLRHRVGAMNIDGCRIGDNPGYSYAADRNGTTFHGQQGERIKQSSDMKGSDRIESRKGRWPANVILQHSEGCVCVGTRDGKPYAINRFDDGMKPFGNGAGHAYKSLKQDSVTEEVWACVPGCPVRLLDAQTGILKTTWVSPKHKNNRQVGRFLGKLGHPGFEGYNDSGGASRFFYCAKTSQKERNAGLGHLPKRRSQKMGDGLTSMVGHPSGKTGNTATQDRVSQNNHPTVKPIDLMRYLTRLVTPPDGVVLDPCCGSGSTGCACMLEGFRNISVELDNDAKVPAVVIARARIRYWEKESEKVPSTRKKKRRRS